MVDSLFPPEDAKEQSEKTKSFGDKFEFPPFVVAIKQFKEIADDG